MRRSTVLSLPLQSVFPGSAATYSSGTPFRRSLLGLTRINLTCQFKNTLAYLSGPSATKERIKHVEYRKYVLTAASCMGGKRRHDPSSVVIGEYDQGPKLLNFLRL